MALSDSDGSEDLANQNTSNVVLDAVSNFHYGELLGACLTDKEPGTTGFDLPLRAGLPVRLMGHVR